MILSDAQIDRYSRQIVMAEVGGRGQRHLLDSEVALIGEAGGLLMARAYLSAAGLGAIGLIVTNGPDGLGDTSLGSNPDCRMTRVEAPGTGCAAVMAVISSEASLGQAIRMAQASDCDWIVARVDGGGLIGVLPDGGPCLKCAPAAELCAPFSTVCDKADFVALTATLHLTRRLLAKPDASPSSHDLALIRFSGFATSFETYPAAPCPHRRRARPTSG